MDEDLDSILFVGKYPPFLFFEMEYHSLFSLVSSHANDRSFNKDNPATEVCLIGLVAFFEAFCKHQFAAIANISPNALKNFAVKRGQAAIKLSDIVSLSDRFEQNLGFLLAEQYDFGSAKMINSLFFDLIQVTPFSKEESETFDSILNKRHLLVHHAGVITLRYSREDPEYHNGQHQLFKSSITLETEACLKMFEFLFKMAMKVTRVTSKALQTDFQSSTATSVASDAASKLLRGVYDNLG